MVVLAQLNSARCSVADLTPPTAMLSYGSTRTLWPTVPAVSGLRGAHNPPIWEALGEQLTELTDKVCWANLGILFSIPNYRANVHADATFGHLLTFGRPWGSWEALGKLLGSCRGAPWGTTD